MDGAGVNETACGCAVAIKGADKDAAAAPVIGAPADKGRFEEDDEEDDAFMSGALNDGWNATAGGGSGGGGSTLNLGGRRKGIQTKTRRAVG